MNKIRYNKKKISGIILFIVGIFASFLGIYKAFAGEYNKLSTAAPSTGIIDQITINE